MTGRESSYTQALALWDELGLQGWLDENEQTIKTLGVRVAAQGEYAVRQTFDGAVWIGSKDYREASWKDFAGFAHTLKLGGFTVYTRLPGPVPEEQSAQKAKLEALSAMVQISWKEPENKAAKAQKYKLSKPTEPVLTFTSFNFKLAVMEQDPIQTAPSNVCRTAYSPCAATRTQMVLMVCSSSSNQPYSPSSSHKASAWV